ncbi:MAG: twitching motility protein PilT [Acidimicrobiales bacterium]
MSLILESGALIAPERDDRSMWARLKAARLSGQLPRTHGGVVDQVWRGLPRQARLARSLAGIEVVPLDEALGHSAGALLARTGGADAIDAAVACLAGDGDSIVTSDPGELRTLAAASGRHVEVIAV